MNQKQAAALDRLVANIKEAGKHDVRDAAAWSVITELCQGGKLVVSVSNSDRAWFMTNRHFAGIIGVRGGVKQYGGTVDTHGNLKKNAS